MHMKKSKLNLTIKEKNISILFVEKFTFIFNKLFRRSIFDSKHGKERLGFTMCDLFFFFFLQDNLLRFS